jgi:predicted amidophosphoribosyltransferase
LSQRARPPARDRRDRDRVLAHLVALVAPPACAGCRSPVSALEVLCGGCRRTLPWLPRIRCPRCALPLPCGDRCPASGAAFAAAWAAVAYEGVAADCVRALKFARARPLAALMAAQLAAGAPPALIAGAALVPVPGHPARVRTRGFDQATLLARALAVRTGRPLAPVLRRRGPATRQLGASRRERLAPGRLLIGVAAAPPRVAALVDDVHTTGATLDACARALRAAGSERVVALSWARTLR